MESQAYIPPPQVVDMKLLDSCLESLSKCFKEISEKHADYDARSGLIVFECPKNLCAIRKYYDRLRARLSNEAEFQQEYGAGALEYGKSLLEEAWSIATKARATLACSNYTKMHRIYTRPSAFLPIPRELQNEPRCADLLAHHSRLKSRLTSLHHGEAVAMKASIMAYHHSTGADQSEEQAQQVRAENGVFYTRHIMRATFERAQLMWYAFDESHAEFLAATGHKGGEVEDDVMRRVGELRKEAMEMFERFEATVGVACMEKPL